MAQDSRERVGRREFFKKALGAASVTALAVGGAARPAFAQQTGDELRKARYQETEHVQAFYRTNRYYRPEEE